MIELISGNLQTGKDYTMNAILLARLARMNARIEYGINWATVYYPVDNKDTVIYTIRILFDNPDFRFIESTAAQFHL